MLCKERLEKNFENCYPTVIEKMVFRYSSTDTTPDSNTQRRFLGSYTFPRGHRQKGPGIMLSQRELAGSSI